MKKSPSIYRRSIDDAYQSSVQGQKKVALNVLSKLKYIDPNAILAGGAPRDWRLGIEIRDLDFYFKAPNHKTDTQIENLLQDIGVLSVGKIEECSGYENIPHISSVWGGVMNDIKCNFILMEEHSSNDYTNGFSNSLSKCWMDDKGVMSYSPDFEKSVANNTIYLYRNYTESSPHIQKVRMKYPKYIVKHKSYWNWEE